MIKHNIECLIVSAPFGYMPTPDNCLYYISNYIPFFSLGVYLVFPLKGEPQLYVSTALGPQFQHVVLQTSWIRDVIGTLHPAQDIVRKIKQLKLENGRLGIIGYRAGIFPASTYDALRESLQTAIFEDATSMLNEAMNEVSRSSEEELTLLKKTCEIQDLSFEAVARALKPGVREYELWAAAEQAIINNGGWYPHFMLVTSGPSPMFPKAPAAHNTINEGDVVIFEVNVIYAGITSQISYALSLGHPRKEVEEMYRLCDELYAFSLVELEKNKKFLDIELDLARRIHSAGYEPMTPQIHVYNQTPVMPMDKTPQPGDYFTVHPNVCNKDYTASAKFGDTVRVTKDGKVERMQKTPAKLNII